MEYRNSPHFVIKENLQKSKNTGVYFSDVVTPDILRDVCWVITGQTNFTYQYVDNQGITHDWVVGLNSENIENYGYAEYLKTDTWQGGYSARVNINSDGTTDARWLESWKTENDCPW